MAYAPAPAVAAKPAAPIVNISPPRPKTLAVGSLTLATAKRNHWVGEADADMSLEDMLKPEFWVHDARKYTPRDEIEVWAKDGSWMEVFIVRSVALPEVGRPVVKVVRKDDIPRADDKPPEPKAVNGMIAKWHGPHAKWVVIRTSDLAVIRDKFDTREDAEEFLSKFTG